jgi:outer membrane protein assembly factor BamD
MKRLRPKLSALALGALLLGGCSTRQVNPASLAPDELYRRATTAYEAGKYGRAIPLLEAFVRNHLADERAPQARMMLGRAHMKRHEWISAATEFQRVVEDFPSSPLNLEARFAICESYVQLSPKPTLDQEYTRAALAHCQSVSDYFAGTPEAQKAAEYVREMQRKLAQKVYDNGVFYRKRKAYDAAVVYFNDVVATYPETSLAPAALQQLVETYGILGYVEEAQQAREKLRSDYPESPEAKALPPADSAMAGSA